LVRAGRLVQHRKRLVDRVEAELGQRVRRRAEQRAEVARARREWETAASHVESGICLGADLVEGSAYLVGLSRRALFLAAEEEKMATEEDVCRKALLAARTELKKIEIWRDRLVEAIRAEEGLLERRATDDLAARIVRSA
jgi:flagellar export protein FliJ